MEPRQPNLHVSHCAVFPLCDGIMAKILFRYSLIISQTQLADKLGLRVLTRKTGNISACLFSFYQRTITIFMRGTLQWIKFYSLAVSFFPFFNETPPRKSLKHLSV